MTKLPAIIADTESSEIRYHMPLQRATKPKLVFAVFEIFVYASITQSLRSIRSGPYGQCVRSPQNLPQMRSHTVSAYGLYGQVTVETVG